MAGALDEKFCAIGVRLAEAIGANATFTTIPDAGHAAHLEQPEAVIAATIATIATSATIATIDPS